MHSFGQSMADLTDRHIFVTGGTGFVGRCLLAHVSELAASRPASFSMTVLSRDPAGFLNRNPQFANLGWLHFMRGDIASLKADGRAFTDVIHAAADTHGMNGRAWVEQIVGGTDRALTFAVESRAKRFLFLSSGAVYGQPREGLLRLREDTPEAPSPQRIGSVYGQAKRLAEQLCTIYHSEYGLETVSARCFALVSEFMPFDGPYAVGNFIRDAVRSEQIVVTGDGRAVRSYLHGWDLAAWLLELLTRGAAGEAYNVGSDEAISVAGLASKVAALLNPGAEVIVKDLKDGARSAPAIYVPDISKARSLGLMVKTGLDDAIITAARGLRD